MNSTLRLFKALPVVDGAVGAFDADLTRQTVALGFIFAPAVTKRVVGVWGDLSKLFDGNTTDQD